MKLKFLKRSFWLQKFRKFLRCCKRSPPPSPNEEEEVGFDRYDYKLDVFVGDGKIVRINDSKIPHIPIPTEEEPQLIEPLRKRILDFLKKILQFLRPVALYILTVDGFKSPPFISESI